MKIAIFGGSFDPPHKGHVSIVKTALKKLDIEKLIIVPAYLNPFKSVSHATPEQRLGWLEKMFSDYPNVDVSDYEVAQGKPVTSIETVKHFKNDVDELYLIIGADNLAKLHLWNRFDELDTLVRWVVATRDDISVPAGYLTLHIDEPVSSTMLRERIDAAYLPDEIADDIVKHYKETNGTTH